MNQKTLYLLNGNNIHVNIDLFNRATDAAYVIGLELYGANLKMLRNSMQSTESSDQYAENSRSHHEKLRAMETRLQICMQACLLLC
jgi:hypothetical protein